MNSGKLPSVMKIGRATQEPGLPSHMPQKLCVATYEEFIKGRERYYLTHDSLHDFLTEEKGVQL